MSAVAAARTLADVVVAPGGAWRTLAAAPRSLWLCLWVMAVHSLLAAAHAHNAWTAIASELPAAADDTRRGIELARVVMVALVPLWTVLRALLLAAVLGATATAPLRRRMALALALEAVPLLESAALAATTAAVQPTGAEALRAVQLRAGLDLVWRPPPGWAASILSAANVFSVWWAVLFVAGAVHVLGARWRRAAAVGCASWILRVLWRAAWSAAP